MTIVNQIFYSHKRKQGQKRTKNNNKQRPPRHLCFLAYLHLPRSLPTRKKKQKTKLKQKQKNEIEAKRNKIKKSQTKTKRVGLRCSETASKSYRVL